jgi:predicted acylesterase/phospholipase RssA
MPAVFPPAVSKGEVIVDGAVLDNIPVRSMHRQCPGAIITVDVSPPVDVEADPTLSECPPAGSLLWRRIVQDPVDLPSLGDILNRSLACADLAAKSELQRLSSLYLTPPMEEFSFMGGERIDEIVEAGYRYAVEALEDFEVP